MKIYTNTFDLRQPSEKKFWVAPHSDFKIGINVLGYNGTEMTYPPSNIDLYKDGVKLTVDSNDGNMTYWKIKSEGTGEVTYTVKAKRNNNKVVGELKLIQVVTDSTVYDQESGGEIPSDLEVDSIQSNDIDAKNIRSQGGAFYTLSEGCNNSYTAKIDSNGHAEFNTIKASDAEFHIIKASDGCITLGCDYIQTPTMNTDNLIVMDNITTVKNGETKLQINSNKIIGDLVEFTDGCASNGAIEMRGTYKSTGCAAPSMYFEGWYGTWSQSTDDYPFIEINDSDTDKKICFNLTNLVQTINNTGYGCGFPGNYSFRPTIAKDKNGNDIVVLAISQPT